MTFMPIMSVYETSIANYHILALPKEKANIIENVCLHIYIYWKGLKSMYISNILSILTLPHNTE